MANLRFNKAATFSLKGVDRAKRQFSFIFTVERPDRDNEIVHVDGINTENFMKNPVICYAHDHGQTIGHVVSIARSSVDGYPALVGVGQIDPPGTSDLADQVYAQIQAGSLRAMSIGFASWRKVGDTYEESELLEVSVVPLPANADCIITEKNMRGDAMQTKEEQVPVVSAQGKISCPRGKNCPLLAEQAVEDCAGYPDGVCPFDGALAPGARGANPVEASGVTPGSVPGVGDIYSNPKKEFAVEFADEQSVDIEAAVREGIEDASELETVKAVLNETLAEGLRDEVRQHVSSAIRKCRGKVD